MSKKSRQANKASRLAMRAATGFRARRKEKQSNRSALRLSRLDARKANRLAKQEKQSQMIAAGMNPQGWIKDAVKGVTSVTGILTGGGVLKNVLGKGTPVAGIEPTPQPQNESFWDKLMNLFS